ncbi:hypothetical protein H2200_006872 [Cladophialophora chaetospira]|uniref:Store-operated calcium entry-associated regulatory factor n=1 Tax=Cladophialophora chaetospira TaxID=386627 RepID=A0AA39CIC7_9EURO|nr:hypothetical protein H2200_006872 [Cladophialophora chaetospira]
MKGFAGTTMLFLLTLLFIGTALSAKVTNPKKVPKNAILLSKVSALTVRAGKQTSSRRVSPVPQLQCVGSSRVCSLYAVDVMRCTNEGSDYDEGNVQWSCKASLPEEFKLGSTDVTCEGYESSDDPYVLRGSCGVEYRLLLTDKGEEKYGSGSWFDQSGSGSGTNMGEKYAGYVFMGIFLVVLFIIIRSIYNAWRNDAPRRRPRGGGGFGGFGGGGDGNDPPPPYDPRPPSQPRKATWSQPSSSRTGTTGGGQQGQAWRPGFWTGTAAGAAAGYYAGRGARTQPDPPPARPARGSGWFGGGGNGGYTAPASPPSSRTASSSSSNYSSTRHESTGFGGTSRR